MTTTISDKISGWIILDKQSGITSRQAVSRISKCLNLNKVGHGGTLDPLATGILPIAIGEATKLISFIQNKKKNIHLQLNGVRQQIPMILKERLQKHQNQDRIRKKFKMLWHHLRVKSIKHLQIFQLLKLTVNDLII